jgi:putative membrane protein
MTESHDDVSKIHKRYSLTLLTPSSRYHSLIFSTIAASILCIITLFSYLGRQDELAFRLPLLIAVLLATQYLDSRFIKNREYSKALHLSLFGNVMWVGIALSGIAASAILSKQELPLFYVAEGMMIFASFRIGIFTTTLGTSMIRAWALCFMQPLAMYLVLMPYDLWASSILNQSVLGIGVAFLAIATVWSFATDRAGRPGVESTHKLVQAYLASRSKGNFDEVESIIASRSKPSSVITSQIRLYSKDSDFRMVLPEIHPGPYHPIGGSNITYRIYKTMNSSAMVMHSVSDHALNLPSKTEVDNYLASLANDSVFKKGAMCTEPVTVQVNKARVIGILFEKTAVLFLSLSPHGMEDVPNYIKKEIEQFASNRNFERIMIVDCHNAMGEEISEPDSQDMLKAAKAILETLITKQSYPMEFGYANFDEMNLTTPDLGPGGIGILCLKINNAKYFLGWADANNMENGVREEIVNHFAKNGFVLLEICTSDTHFSSTIVRNRTGYYPFGKVTEPEDIASWYLKLAEQADKKLDLASFEILEHKTDVRVMGAAILEDFSEALDRSMLLSKAFMAGSMALFITSLFL